MEPHPKTDQSTLALGDVFGHYRIESHLGQGGMGVVYRAHDFRLGRPVALKVLNEAVREDSEAQMRLVCEARIAATLSHPNICVIYEAGEEDGCAFISMECVDGQGLSQMVRPLGLPLKVVASYGAQIAGALHYAHVHGVIHRDVKCANVIISDDDQAKVLDFGLAQLTLFKNITELAISRSGLAELGPFAGTLPYLAPEILHGKAASPRSDIWALGVVLFEMATGKVPFQGNTAFELSMAIMAGTAPEMNAVPPALREVVARCLERDPARRYQAARDVSKELSAVSEPSSGRPRAPLNKRGLLVAGALILIASLVVGVPWMRDHIRHRSLPPRENGSIVLAQLSNQTGDPVFDNTLNQALAVALQQSPVFSILPASQIRQALGYLGKDPTAKLTPELARKVCARAGGGATVQGSIARIGASYVIGIIAEDCHTGDVLAELQETTSTKENVLEILGSATAQLRTKLGESLQSIRQYDVPIVRATTSSFAALQSFSLGVRAAEGPGGYGGAIPLFRRAIALDPQFASAYESLGVAYAGLGELGLARENLRKAYDLRNQVSEPERLQIEAHYYDLVTGDLTKAREVYELWTSIYPQNAMAHGNLATCHALQGDYVQALNEVQKALGIDPGDVTWTSNLVSFYLALGRLPEASSALAQALNQNSDDPYLHIVRYQLAFLEHDSAGRAKEVAWAANKSGVEDVLLAYESDTQAYYGHLAAARELSRRAVESAQRSGQKEIAAGWRADAALREALLGNAAAARSDAVGALADPDRDVSAISALALALVHDPQAERIADELARRFPEDTSVNMSYLPAIRGAIALNKGRPQQAIALLQDATAYEMGTPTTSSLLLVLYPAYIRGLAYLALGRGAEAVDEFDKIRVHPGIVLNEPIGALCQLQEARAHALVGDVAASHKSYEDFRALWNTADENIPVLKQASATGEHVDW